MTAGDAIEKAREKRSDQFGIGVGRRGLLAPDPPTHLLGRTVDLAHPALLFEHLAGEHTEGFAYVEIVAGPVTGESREVVRAHRHQRLRR